MSWLNKIMNQTSPGTTNNIPHSSGIQPEGVEYIPKEFVGSFFAGWSGGGWYFWSTDHKTCYGPYNRKEEAEAALWEHPDFEPDKGVK